ncbi:DUF4373 domain-containing protein [Enterococcus rotai]|uniref:DUF4373 domain-containing protein n=1 Tax=Enterococcus rotai TaxID=118060 RepID=UPI0035C66CB2
MARPIKKGIDYFPLDVNFLSDIKVRKVMRAYSTKAIAILISLLSSIYREEGYYVVWDDDLAFLIADELGISEGLVSDVISKATEVGIFDKGMADKFKVLTSKGIQDRYKKAAYQKKNNEIAKQYDLLSKSCDKPRADDESSSDNSVNHAESTQSKVKESKGNKSKDNTSKQQLEQDFELLWNLYPRKEGKQKAFTAYKRAIKKGVTNKVIQDGIVGYNKQIEVKETSREYIKQGSTFFNGEHWNDEFDYSAKTVNGPYRQPVRQETMPDWVENPTPEAKLSPEEQAKLDAEIKAFLSKGGEIK